MEQLIPVALSMGSLIIALALAILYDEVAVRRRGALDDSDQFIEDRSL